MIPSHIGSIPNAKIIGATIGTTTNVISIKSKTNPKKNIATITTIKIPTTPPGTEVKND